SGEFWVATPVHLAELKEETSARISPEEMEEHVARFVKNHPGFELLAHSQKVISVSSLAELVQSIEAGYARGEKDQSLALRAMADAAGTVPGALAAAGGRQTVDIGVNIRQDRQRLVKERLLASPAAKYLAYVSPQPHVNTQTPESYWIEPLRVPHVLSDVLDEHGIALTIVTDRQKETILNEIFRGGRPRNEKSAKETFINHDLPLHPASGKKLRDSEFYLMPRLSSDLVGESTCQAVRSASDGSVIVANVSNMDLMGHAIKEKNPHPGDEFWKAGIEGVRAADDQIGRIVEAVREKKGWLLVSSDHGMLEDLQVPGHTRTPVPLYIIGYPEGREEKPELVQYQGTQDEVAPTILQILGLDIPKEMTGKPLLANAKGDPKQVVVYVVLDGYAEGDANYEWNLVERARELGFTKNLDYLRSHGARAIHEASGLRAGVRGGAEDFSAAERLSSKQVFELLEHNAAIHSLSFCDYTAKALRSKVIEILRVKNDRARALYEVQHNPFLNERYFVIENIQDGVLTAWVVDPTQSGSTEFNHWTMGAGRVVTQPIVLADLAYADGSAFKSQALGKALEIAASNGYVNLDMILQEAAIHGSQRHLYYLMNFFLKHNVSTFYVDLAFDGRDEENGRGLTRLKALLEAVQYFEWRYGRPVHLIVRRIEGRERMYQRAKDQEDVIRHSANYLLFGPYAVIYRR
ncbi:MAG: hypothetical protein HY586_04205, partial [Candidatus Omnitrophica bacterium]|nr:hypothetical protein [Candidatus Omnitrophota bacterium]